MTSVSDPVTVCPAHTAVALTLGSALTCCADATPSVVRLPLAEEVTIPLPDQFPPLRPDWICPVTPLYVPPLALPTGFCVTSLLSVRSNFAPLAMPIGPGMKLTPP